MKRNVLILGVIAGMFLLNSCQKEMRPCMINESGNEQMILKGGEDGEGGDDSGSDITDGGREGDHDNSSKKRRG